MLLGIDLGTARVKVIAVDAEGNIQAESYKTYSALPGPSYQLEHDPHAWWKACRDAVRDLKESLDGTFEQVEAVGLSGQTHGLVLVDGDGEPVRPCMTWADRRCTVEAEELDRAIGNKIRERCANPILEAFTAPKLAWVAKNEPESLKRTSHLLLPKDYIRGRLTGLWATDPSDAASTLLFDLRSQRWDAELVAEAGGSTGLLSSWWTSH